MYSYSVILSLVGMIVFGAARSVVIKIYFQLQEETGQAATPMFVTLLYMLAHAVSLLAYLVERRIRKHYNEKLYLTVHGSTSSDCGDSNTQSISEGTDDSPASLSNELDLDAFEDEEMLSPDKENIQPTIIERPKLVRQGSATGLTQNSKDAVAWVHTIPWYIKPAIPAFFNLCCTALRWASLVFVAASLAEILINAMELVFSSFAARIFRKRLISPRRWIGVTVVTIGVLGVGLAKAMDKKDSSDEEHKFFVGNLLIFGQCIFSVFQDLSEEIILQEAEYPATLLLGMEGLFGLAFGIPLYFLFSSEHIYFTRFNLVWGVGIVLVVLLTGLFNLYATEVTSSMTRNVWRQFRTALVWVTGLLIYYMGSDLGIGEPWSNPSSWFILGGFSVIVMGVYGYYSDRSMEKIFSIEQGE